MPVVVVVAKLQTQEQAALVVAVLRLQVVLQAILVHLILVEMEVPLAAPMIIFICFQEKMQMQ
jgi:hypothetical protein